jgi:hypothetical protein
MPSCLERRRRVGCWLQRRKMTLQLTVYTSDSGYRCSASFSGPARAPTTCVSRYRPTMQQAEDEVFMFMHSIAVKDAPKKRRRVAFKGW